MQRKFKFPRQHEVQNRNTRHICERLKDVLKASWRRLPQFWTLCCLGYYIRQLRKRLITARSVDLSEKLYLNQDWTWNLLIFAINFF